MRYRPPPVCPSAAGVPPGTGGVRPCAGALARVGSRVANGRRARGGKRTGPHGSLFAALTRHGRPTVVPPDEVGPPQSHRSVDPPEPHRSPTAVAGTPPAAALCRLAPGEKRGWPCGSLAMRLGLARVRAARGTGAACLGTARGLLWGALRAPFPPGGPLYTARGVWQYASRVEIVRGCRACSPALDARSRRLPASWWTAARSRPGPGGLRSCRSTGIGGRHCACRGKDARSCLAWLAVRCAPSGG